MDKEGILVVLTKGQQRVMKSNSCLDKAYDMEATEWDVDSHDPFQVLSASVQLPLSQQVMSKTDQNRCRGNPNSKLRIRNECANRLGVMSNDEFMLNDSVSDSEITQF